jgi:CubicO group peptidase (beta-lactamase class C family)
MTVWNVDLQAQYESEIKSIENNITPSLQIKGDSIKPLSIEDEMIKYNVKNLSIAVILDGKIRWAKAYGKLNAEGSPVDENTIFQAASISKPVAASGVHKLVQKDLLDLDADVNQYLQSWRLPNSRFTEKEKVTLRRLMTHTAGTTVHGFPGYGPDEAFPSDDEVLNGEGNTDRVEVDTFPGSINRYSGGGYTIMEKVMEDVTGMDFADYMEEEVLRPFGMIHSTYQQPLPDPLHSIASHAFNGSGGVYPGFYHHYPEQAAAGLWTTPSDLARFLIGIQEAYQGKSEKVLNRKMAEVFLTRNELGHGHGPAIMGEGDDLAFGHGGKNAGFTCNMYASANKGYGMVIMSGSDSARPVIDALQRSIAEYYGWEWEKPEVIEVIDIDAEGLSVYTGKYLFRPASITVELFVNEDLLTVKTPTGDQVKLYHLGDHLFIDLSNGTRIKFIVDESGICTGLVQGGRTELEKVE